MKRAVEKAGDTYISKVSFKRVLPTILPALAQATSFPMLLGVCTSADMLRLAQLKTRRLNADNRGSLPATLDVGVTLTAPSVP